MAKKTVKVKAVALFSYEVPNRPLGGGDETDPTTTMITKTISGIFMPKKR